jgi:uncharacterized protein YyaL (SSP411 family)
VEERLQPMLDAIFGRYLPNRVVAGATDGDRGASTGIPLLETRPTIRGRPTAYLCKRYVCQAPTTDPAELARQLQEA